MAITLPQYMVLARIACHEDLSRTGTSVLRTLTDKGLVKKRGRHYLLTDAGVVAVSIGKTVHMRRGMVEHRGFKARPNPATTAPTPPTPAQHAGALLTLTERYVRGFISKSTWLRHTSAIWRRVRAEGIDREVEALVRLVCGRGVE